MVCATRRGGCASARPRGTAMGPIWRGEGGGVRGDAGQGLTRIRPKSNPTRGTVLVQQNSTCIDENIDTVTILV